MSMLWRSGVSLRVHSAVTPSGPGMSMQRSMLDVSKSEPNGRGAVEDEACRRVRGGVCRRGGLAWIDDGLAASFLSQKMRFL